MIGNMLLVGIAIALLLYGIFMISKARQEDIRIAKAVGYLYGMLFSVAIPAMFIYLAVSMGGS